MRLQWRCSAKGISADEVANRLQSEKRAKNFTQQCSTVFNKLYQHFPHLTHLILHFCSGLPGCGDLVMLRHLAEHPLWARLRHLQCNAMNMAYQPSTSITTLHHQYMHCLQDAWQRCQALTTINLSKSSRALVDGSRVMEYEDDAEDEAGDVVDARTLAPDAARTAAQIRQRYQQRYPTMPTLPQDVTSLLLDCFNLAHLAIPVETIGSMSTLQVFQVANIPIHQLATICSSKHELTSLHTLIAYAIQPESADEADAADRVASRLSSIGQLPSLT